MGFKKIDRKMGFAELALSSSMGKNISLNLPNFIAQVQLCVFECIPEKTPKTA